MLDFQASLHPVQEMRHLVSSCCLVTCLGYHILVHLPCVNTAKWLHNAVHSWCLVSTVLDPPLSIGSQSLLTGRELHCKHYIVLLGNNWHFRFISISTIASHFNNMRNMCSILVMEISFLDYCTRLLNLWIISTDMSNQTSFMHNWIAYRKWTSFS